MTEPTDKQKYIPISIEDDMLRPAREKVKGMGDLDYGQAGIRAPLNKERLLVLVRESIDEELARFKGEPMNDATRHRVEAQVRSVLAQLHAHHNLPDYFRSKYNGTSEGVSKGIFKMYVVRDFRHYPMTEDEFLNLFDRRPEQDDLHRVNCKEAGELGHFSCGWCMRHETAMFDCGCLPDLPNKPGTAHVGSLPSARSEPRPGVAVSLGCLGTITPAVLRPPEPMRVAANVDADRYVTSASDVADACRDGALDKDQAMALASWFCSTSRGAVVLTRHVPEDTPPWSALVFASDIVRFVRERFPDVHESQVETVVDEMRYVLTCTTHLAGQAERDDLQRRIARAIEPHGALAVTFEVRAIPVDGNPYR